MDTYIARRAEIVEPTQVAQATLFQLISNLHGVLGTFSSRQDAFTHAKAIGIPTSGNGLAAGYTIKAVPIKLGPG
jgi:hypothetical protein